MTAAEALVDRKLIREIAARAGLDERTVRNALDGWRPRGSSRRETFDAASSLGVDVATVPARTDAANAAWLAKQRAPRKREPPRPPMPEGFANERCDCGREYPRMQSEAEGKCPTCWRKDRNGWKQAAEEARAESESLRESAADAPVPMRRAR